jgi:NAD(P)-dependent dehydrogenase (short-subunit alcohol dehydrogenase family)
MKKKLENKVALITGGSRGIGAAIARLFAKEGAFVIIADIKATEGQKVIEEIENGTYIHCDVSDDSQINQLFAYISSNFHKIDIVVNNAAIAIYKPLEEYDSNQWDRILNTNLKSIYNTSRYALPLMKKQNNGNIISIASIHAKTTSVSNGPYVASKGAIVSLTRAMALEGAPYNIRVNCISPGAIETSMLMENWGSVPVESHPLLARIPLKRIGKPEEIAKAALFLASEDSSYITGNELLVDGGLSAHFD